MKRLTLLLVIVLLGVSGIRAQIPFDALVVYRPADGGVAIFIEQTGERHMLLSAEQAPSSAEVRADFLGSSGMFFTVQVMEVNNHTPYPADYNGNTIGELGLQNTLYLFGGGTSLMFQRSLLPDDFIIDFFMDGGEVGYIYDPMLDADFAVQKGGLSYFFWVEGAADFADEYVVNGYGRLAAYDDIDGAFIELDVLPGTPHGMMWSRNERYGVFRAITNFGTGAGYSSAGTYLLNANDLSLQQITPCCRDITAYGWLDSGQFIYSYFSPMAGAAGLFAYDPASDTTITLLPEEQDNIDSLGTDIQAISGQILVTVSDIYTPEGDGLLPPGTYLYSSLTAEPELIYNLATGAPADRATFISADTVFVANVNPRYVGNYSISTGELLPDELAEGYVYPSPYGVTLSPTDGGALMYEPVLEGGAQYFIPNLMPDYVRWFDPEFFLFFIPHQPSNLDGSSWVMFVQTNGNYKVIDLGEGNYVLAAMFDPIMR